MAQPRNRFELGVNYWSRTGGPRMWELFDRGDVAREVGAMRNIGLSACRAFAFVPTFMRQPPYVDGEALARFSDFLDLCRVQKLSVFGTPLVGHMSGENHPFPGQANRSLYEDPELIAWQRALVRRLAETGKGRVSAWILSNEMPLWGGASDPVTTVRWAKTLIDETRQVDPDCRVGTGDGVMNLKGGQNGFDPQALAGIIDFVGPHTYPTDSDPLRQAFAGEFVVRMLDYLGLPVLLEEFGASSTQVGDQQQAAYYREVVHGCMAIGAAGAFWWCFSDFDLSASPPYSHHPFELGFGMFRSDGSEKPICQEVRTAAATVERLSTNPLEPEEPRAAVVVPSYFFEDYPFSREDRSSMRRTLLQTLVLCSRAGFEVRFVPETAPLDDYRLLLVPSMQKLLATTWEKLKSHAESGTHLYISYFGGDFPFHQGQWCHNFTELTGLKHGLRYGCFDIPPDVVELRGDVLVSPIAVRSGRSDGTDPWARSYLPVEPAGAEILATDAQDRPALAQYKLGGGSVTFLAYPFERYIADHADANEHDRFYTLYRQIAVKAGLIGPGHPVSSDARATIHRASHGEEAEVIWIFNRAWRSIEVSVPDRFQGVLGPKEVKLVRTRR